MGLVAHEPVDDMDPGLLELLRPLDVVRLVETRLELDEGRHLLVVARSLDQRPHDRGVSARPVERLLDRDDLRVPGRLLDEVDDRGEGVVRVVEQHVLLAHHVEYPGGLPQGGDIHRRERRELEVRPVHVRQALQPKQVDRAVELVHVFVRQV